MDITYELLFSLPTDTVSVGKLLMPTLTYGFFFVGNVDLPTDFFRR